MIAEDSFECSNIVITGGAGFIGSHLVEKLLNLGATVKVIDKFLNGNKINHLLNSRRLFVYNADVRDAEKVDTIIEGSDIVFHFAAVVGVEEAYASPLDVLNTEIIGTLNVLKSAVKYNVRKLIFASSSEVYGDSDIMTESVLLSPKSTYAIAKIVGEEYCKAFNIKYDLQYVALRYFNVYGKRQDKRFVLPRFIVNIINNDEITIYGDGSQTRDFTYIDDVVHMTLLAAIKNEANCQILNIGTGVAISIDSLVKVVSEVYNRKAKIIYKDYDNIRPREIEVYNRVADTSKTKLLLQYKPVTDLKSGVKKLKGD